MPRVRKSVDASKVTAALKRALMNSVRIATVQVMRGALQVERDAKKLAPVAFGPLRASITHSDLMRTGPSKWGVLVGTNKTYARFVEFGTGPAGKSAPLSKTAQEFMAQVGYQYGAIGGMPPDDAIKEWMKRKKIPLDKMFVIQRAIRARGTKAHPFLFPAFERWRNQITKAIAIAMRNVFGEGEA